MTELSADAVKIINLFLYGQENSPDDLDSKDWIRAKPASPPVFVIPLDEYMTTGAGRFALASKFALTQFFFAGAAISHLANTRRQTRGRRRRRP